MLKWVTILPILLHTLCSAQQSPLISDLRQHLNEGDLDLVVSKSDSLLHVLNTDRDVAEVHLLLADVYLGISDRVRQLHELNSAFGIFSNLKDSAGMATVRYQLAHYYFTIRQFETAEEELYNAQTLYTLLNDQAGLSKVKSTFGQVAFERGEITKSVQYFRTSILTADSVGDLNQMALNRARLAYSFWKLDLKDSMLNMLIDANQIALQTKDNDLIVNMMSDLGLALVVNQQYDSAISLLNSALLIATEIKSTMRLRYIYKLLAKCHEENGSFAEAYLYLGKVDSISAIASMNDMASLGHVYQAIQENELLEESHERSQKLIILLSLTVVVLLLVVVLFYNRYMRARLAAKIETERRVIMQDTQQIMTQLPEIITGYDSAGNITFLNKTIDGRDPSELIGMNLSELVSQEECDIRMKAIEDASTQNRTIIDERRTGNKLYIAATSPVKLGSNNTIALSVYTDVTDQRDRDQIIHWASSTAKIGGWIVNLEKGTINWSKEIQNIREDHNKVDTELSDALNYYTQEHKPLIEAAIRRGIEEGIQWDLELEMTTSKGNRKWVRDVGIPEMRGGKCVALRGVLQDITDRKRSELNLQEKERSLELALQGADLGTWDWNITTRRVVINSRWSRMLGYTHGEIKPSYSTWEGLIHPDDKPYVLSTLQAHLNGETDLYQAEYRLQHKAGHWIWIMDRGKVVQRDREGKVLRASGTCLEITDRKRNELEKLRLQTKLREFREAVNASSILSITNLKGIIKYANQKFVEISQYSLDELIGRSHGIINSRYHTREFWKEMWKTIGNGEVWRAEVKNRKKDGTYYWVDTFIIPLRDSDGKINEYLSIRNDITEKKRNEKRLQNALRKAEESDRVKSQFLANISHEIRTPMNAIMGFSELLERPHLSDKKRQEFGRLIYTRSRDLLTIMNDILDISRLEANELGLINVIGDVKELFEKLMTTFQMEAQYIQNKQLIYQTSIQLSTNQMVILCDFIRLHQVLYNLMSNAAKFTPQGTIEVGCRINKGELLFWVKDTGIGIETEKLPFVFLPFRQANDTIHQRFGGSGLGLAICKGLVELWGGQIWCDSQLNLGSTFYFTMPFIPVSDESRAETSRHNVVNSPSMSQGNQQ